MIDKSAERVLIPAGVPVPEPEKPKLVRLDLGCGQRAKEGFQGVDVAKLEGVIQQDLFAFPWQWADDSVDEVFTSHFFEHVPQDKRFAFFDELHRILKPGMRAEIIVPYYNGSRASQDPTHCWPPISEGSFLYANKAWRDANGLSHYGISCDFDFTIGYSYYPQWQNRSEEARAFAQIHYTNVIMDMFVSLVKRELVKK